jgi:protein-tyrosine-phosphatase/predicted ATP-grasp superfamily ATP-dependent carboligase
MNTVLVLDGDKLHALDIVRSLGRRGLSVTVGATRADAISFRSRFAAACVTYPNPENREPEFLEWLQAIISAQPYDLVIPVTDLTAVPISKNLGTLRRLSTFATEPYEKLQLVSDKVKTLELAHRLGIPVPESVVVRRVEDVDLPDHHMAFPVVCKPLSSSVWTGDGCRSLTVSYAFDPDELRRAVQKMTTLCPIILQRYHRGIGVGVEVLARDGEVLQLFQHQRLHELPLTGGGSTYRMSVAVSPTLREYTRRLIDTLRWTGVAMIEFKIDARTGAVIFIEVNGRFWGSLPLSSRAGMSFAADLFDMLVRDTIPPSRPYRVGVRCRKLRDDVEWVKEQFGLDPGNRLVAAGLVRKETFGALTRQIARMFSPFEHYDAQVVWDPEPGLWDLAQLAVTQLGAVRRRVGRALTAWRLRRYASRETARLVERIGKANKVLFVCHGNIARSAFASSYLQGRCRDNPKAFQARCGGVHGPGGRPADPRVIAIARRWGIELSSHRSRRLDDELVAWADVILVMDTTNLRDVRRRFPTAADKTYLLGLLDSRSAREIEILDPFGKDEATMEDTCSRIAVAIERLLLCVRPQGSSFDPSADARIAPAQNGCATAWEA